MSDKPDKVEPKDPAPPSAAPPMPFSVTIISLDTEDQVTAQYNPKELAVDKAVAWQKKDDKTNTSDLPVLEFSGGQGRSMSVELLFDGFEEDTDVHSTYVATLLKLASIIDPKGDAQKKRPHLVKVIWGGATGEKKTKASKGTLPEFSGVIESLNTKYTMFSGDGKPVRATCTVKLKEANQASFKAPKGR